MVPVPAPPMGRGAILVRILVIFWDGPPDRVDIQTMSMMGPLITQSLSQLQASERAAIKPSEPKRATDAKARRRPEDSYDSIASEVDGAQAARRLSANDQEDAHEDREEHQGQQGRAGEAKPGEHPGIDVNG